MAGERDTGESDEGGWERLRMETQALEEARAHVARLQEEVRVLRGDAEEAVEGKDVMKEEEGRSLFTNLTPAERDSQPEEKKRCDEYAPCCVAPS